MIPASFNTWFQEHGGSDARPKDFVARGADPGGTERTGTAASLHDDPFGFGSTIACDSGRGRWAPFGGSRPFGRHDGEACAQVDHAVPKKSPRRATRLPRTRPQAGLFPPRSRCTW